MRRLALLIALFSASVYAQAEPGYVVMQGDTLRTEVEIGTEFDASRGLRYREAGGAWQQAGPPDVEAFGTDAGRRYRRRLLRLSSARPEDSPTPLDRLAFARVVRDGPASLLALEVTPSRPLYFVEVTSGEPAGLYNVQDKVLRGNGLRRVRDLALYRQTLATVLAGCGIDGARFESLPYTEDALAAVVDDYNRCQDTDYRRPQTTVAQRRPSELALEVGAGLTSNAFLRGRGPVTGVTDPDQSSAHLGVLAEWSPSTLPSALAFLLGVEYNRSLIQHVEVTTLSGSSEVQRDAFLVSLGSRLTLDIAGTPVYVGARVQGGRLASRTVRDEIRGGEETSEGYIRAVTSRFLNSVGGTAVEAGIRPLGGRVGLGVQYRWTGFSGSNVFVPGNANRSDRYGMRGVAFTLSGRL